MRQTIQIGEYVVTQAVERTKHYECAAWFTRIRVEPGRYPVMAEVEDGRVRDHPGLMVSMPGTIVEDNFQPLFGGNAIDKAYDRKQNAGKPYTFHFSIYAHTVANVMLDRPEDKGGWELEGFHAERVEFEYDGKPCVTHRIVANGTEPT